MVIIKQIEQTKEENEVKEQKKPVEQMPEKTTKKIQIKGNPKRAMIAVASVLGAIVIVYVGVSVYYMSRFLPGTKLNERKVGEIGRAHV